MATCILTLTVRWPWWRKPFMAALIVAAYLRLPVDFNWAARFLISHTKFETH